MWPTEKQGRIGNFDFSSFEPCFTQTGGTLALCDSPSPGFIVPDNVQTTGLGNVDAAIAVTARAGNNHTLSGQDRNNFAPRIGFAYSPLDSNRLVIRGGFGILLRSPIRGFHQHGLQQLSVPARDRNHRAVRQRAHRQLLFSAEHHAAAEQLAAVSYHARCGRRRHLRHPRQHRRYAGRARQPDCRQATSPRRLSFAPSIAI